jgi:hypothetical protein
VSCLSSLVKVEFCGQATIRPEPSKSSFKAFIVAVHCRRALQTLSGHCRESV